MSFSSGYGDPALPGRTPGVLSHKNGPASSRLENRDSDWQADNLLDGNPNTFPEHQSRNQDGQSGQDPDKEAQQEDQKLEEAQKMEEQRQKALKILVSQEEQAYVFRHAYKDFEFCWKTCSQISAGIVAGNQLAMEYHDPHLLATRMTSIYSDAMGLYHSIQGGYSSSTMPGWLAAALAEIRSLCNNIWRKLNYSTDIQMMDSDVRQEMLREPDPQTEATLRKKGLGSAGSHSAKGMPVNS